MSHTSTGTGPVASKTHPRARAVLHPDGNLVVGPRSVSVTDADGRILDELLRRSGDWCPAQVLLDAGWPDGADPTALDNRLLLLNRRLRAVGLRILTHQQHGATLEPTPGGIPR